MKRSRNYYLLITTFLSIFMIACQKPELSLDDAPMAPVNQESLKSEHRQTLTDSEGISYLFLPLDNKPGCTGRGQKSLKLTQDEMEVFSHNLMFNVDYLQKDLPPFEYVIIQFFDFETKEQLSRFKYLM